MSCSSQGSASTALAAGSGMPITTPTKTKKSDTTSASEGWYCSSGGNSPIVGTKKGRRASKNNERETNTTTNNAAPTMVTSQEGGGGGGGIGGGAGWSNNKDDGNAVVPHVVRVTFLGVSGLLAKPPHPPLPTAATNGRTIEDTTSAATAIAESSGNSTMTTPTTTQTTSITSSAAPNHPSLLLPLPSHLRLVASISRSRTARGIPSELSNHLTKSSSSSSSTDRHNIDNNRGSEKNSSPSGDGVKVNGGSELGRQISIISNNERPIVQHHEDQQKQQKQQQQVSERYVAIWDDDGMSKRPNSLAFEADLRPSNVVALEGSGAGGGGGGVTKTDNAAGAVDARTNTHLASTAYAPKSFFITIGLVSDCNSSNGTLPMLQHHQGSTTATTTKTKTTYLPTSTFAIPLAFTDLVINGEETLNGKRKQIDLPLSSLDSIINVFGEDNILGPTPNNNNINSSGNINLPLIELSTTGIGTKVAGNNNDNNSTTVITDKKTTHMMSNTTTMSPKTKKKSLIKRILSRKPLHPLSSTAATTSPVSTTPISSEEVYSGTLPRSIYELDRPPNVNERALFLNRYGIDDGGGAVLRIGLEVFPRGSELERIFRQKKYLRKKYAQAAESSSRKGMMSSKKKIGTMMVRRRGSGDDYSTQYTTNSIDNNALDSPSLMDTLDEESDYYHDNEDGSMTYSESYFTFDDNNSLTSSWDESTMGYTGYTDEFSRVTSYGTYNSLDTYNSGEYDVDEDEEKVLSPGGLDSIKSSGNFFSTLLCHIDTTCGDDKSDTVVTSSSSTVGVGPNFSMDENSITIDNRHMILSCTSSNQQQQKGGSTDDASENMTKQHTNQENAVMYPNDTSNDNASEPESCSIEISPDDIADVEDTSLNIAKQTTPLELIMQRISDETFHDKNVIVAGGKRELKEEGHELTLEDHVSSSM